MSEVNGSLVVTWWGLPPELASEGVKVEVNVSGVWVEVGGANAHTLPPSPSREDNYTIYLRVSQLEGREREGEEEGEREEKGREGEREEGECEVIGRLGRGGVYRTLNNWRVSPPKVVSLH